MPRSKMLHSNLFRPVVLAIPFLALFMATAVSACITAESERNNRDTQADGPLCDNTTVSGAISSRRDVDWFYFDLTTTGTLTFSLDHNTSDDFDWYLYRESGGSIASAASSQVPDDGSYNATATGRYYLKVQRYAGTGWYTLDVTLPTGGGGGGGSCGYGSRPAKPGGLSVWQTGSTDDACANPTGPGLLLMGGGSDVDAAFTGRVAPVIGGGDVVVLRTSGSNGYNSYLYNLMSPDSVETLLVDSVSKADSDYVEWVVESAEFVFIAGGDQSDYLNNWQGTRLEDAIRHVYNKGGVVGGTSAGLAVQSQYIYDPDGILSVYSDEAVTNPCHAYINLSWDFLNLPWMNNIITDSHFQERDRMGRLLTFMARLSEPGIAPTSNPITGIGVDEATSMYLDGNGYGVVDGSGAVYVLREGSSTQLTQVQCGSVVVYEDIERYRLNSGDHFNFATGTSSVSPVLLGIDGGFANFYSPSDPY